MKLCPKCDSPAICCDHCMNYDFNADSEGRYTGAGRADAVTVIHLMTAATLDEESNVAESQQYLSKFRLA